MSSIQTVENVRALVRAQSASSLDAVNDHRITLGEALIEPRMITVAVRTIKNGGTKDQGLNVWLVGQENRSDGYKIILSDDGAKFGLASKGFPEDKVPILVGWYGSLLSAFLGM